MQAASHVKRLYTGDAARVDEAMRLAIQNGTCAIRLFADVDEDSGLNAVDGLLRIRDKYAPIMTVQVGSFRRRRSGAATQRLMRPALSAAPTWSAHPVD
jgi:cytosine/adenosine deaminase-related metal-dependent hydrolase